MKHTIKVTAILIAIFVIIQFLGLLVVNADIFHLEREINGTVEVITNPDLEWAAPPELKSDRDFFSIFPSLIIAFVIAISLLFLLSKYKVKFFLKFWFFAVVTFAIWVSLYAFEKILSLGLSNALMVIIPIIIALPLAYIKIYKSNFLVHNFTELLIYPGIAAIFVPILNVWTIIILLIIISIYDMWAVWKSGIMQKMVHYQMNKMNMLAGLLVPYMSKKVRASIRKIKKSKLKNKKIKVTVAILGGGDIIFPLIAAGIMMKFHGFLPAVLVIMGATLGLTSILFFSKKNTYYPAMPFISSGVFLGMILSYLIF